MRRDFQIPSSLILQLANSPTPIFFTSYSLDALPQLNGSISYITTSEPLKEVSDSRLGVSAGILQYVQDECLLQIGPSRSVPFRHVVERFRVYAPPKRPLPKEEVWHGGRRAEGRGMVARCHKIYNVNDQTICSTLVFTSPPSTCRV
jgi:distribution and morphology protein 10